VQRRGATPDSLRIPEINISGSGRRAEALCTCHASLLRALSGAGGHVDRSVKCRHGANGPDKRCRHGAHTGQKMSIAMNTPPIRKIFPPGAIKSGGRRP
jgi:hypothetical protein